MTLDYPVPPELTEAELAIARGEATTGPPEPAPVPLARPTVDPPDAPSGSGPLPAGFVSVKVLALFASSDTRNGRANLDGLGWRRLAATNDSAHLNLGLLATAARMQGTATPVRHEADEQIHEVYLW